MGARFENNFIYLIGHSPYPVVRSVASVVQLREFLHLRWEGPIKLLTPDTGKRA